MFVGPEDVEPPQSRPSPTLSRVVDTRSRVQGYLAHKKHTPGTDIGVCGAGERGALQGRGRGQLGARAGYEPLPANWCEA